MEKTMAVRETEETCLICEEKGEIGIHICDRFICESCEQKLVKTDTRDESYSYYLEKMRNLCVDDTVKKS